MVGGIGNNLEEPAMLRAHQFIVIDYLAAWPVDSAFLNIRIGTTRYFQDPSEFLTLECRRRLCRSIPPILQLNF